MRALVFLAVLGLLSSACIPVDPGAAVGGAHATLVEATRQAQATYEAQANAAATATLRSAATRHASDAERELLVAQIQASREAVSMVQTLGAETAQVEARQATATAAVMTTSTAGAQEAVIWQATETAISRADRQAQNAMTFRSFIYIVLGLLILILLALLVRYGLELLEWLIVWQDRKHSWTETSRGVVLWLPDEAGNVWPVLRVPGQSEPHQPRYHMNPVANDPGFYELTPSGSVLASAPASHGDNTIHNQAIAMLDQAIEVAGPQSKLIPGYRDLPGWSSSVWQRVVAVLEAHGLVEPRPGVGTYILHDRTLDSLRYILVSNRVHLRPTPPRVTNG